jgi:hypothetical protein
MPAFVQVLPILGSASEARCHSMSRWLGLKNASLARSRSTTPETAGGREDDRCRPPISSMMLLECTKKFARQRIEDLRITVTLVPASASVVFDLTPDEGAPT